MAKNRNVVENEWGRARAGRLEQRPSFRKLEEWVLTESCFVPLKFVVQFGKV